MSFPGKGDMSNQEAYEEICEKAKKYDELKVAVGKIKSELENSYIGECLYDGGIERGISLINKHTEGLI